MKIILEGKEADNYILSRKMGELKDFVKELKKMHDGLRHCNRFELSDLCDKINSILSFIELQIGSVELNLKSNTIMCNFLKNEPDNVD